MTLRATTRKARSIADPSIPNAPPVNQSGALRSVSKKGRGQEHARYCVIGNTQRRDVVVKHVRGAKQQTRRQRREPAPHRLLQNSEENAARYHFFQ